MRDAALRLRLQVMLIRQATSLNPGLLQIAKVHSPPAAIAVELLRPLGPVNNKQRYPAQPFQVPFVRNKHDTPARQAR
jgi:hypothetical protein